MRAARSRYPTHAPALAAGLALLAALSAAASVPLKSRTFVFTYRTEVRELPPGARVLELWLPYPQTDRNQTIHAVTVQAPAPVTISREPREGNRVLYLRIERPTLPLRIVQEVRATRRENAGARELLTPAGARPYLQAEPLVPLDGPVRRLALEATRGRKSDEEKARAIYDRVTSMMRYDKTGAGWGRGDALYACDARRGNCTDFHALIIGMCRSIGLPARFAIGFPLPEDRGAGEVPGYHCWAEIYVRGQGWVPVDSSEAAKAAAAGRPWKKEYFYGHHDENRIEFSRGRNLILSPRQKGAPLNYFIYPYAEVDGRPHPGIEKSFAFADAPAGGAG